MGEYRLLDPSDIHNVVNGLDISECCQVTEGCLVFVFPNLGYGFLAQMLLPNPVGDKTVSQYIEPRPEFSYAIRKDQVSDDSGQQVLHTGIRAFVPLSGTDRSMVVARCAVNRTCEQESSLQNPIKIPIPVKVVPVGNDQVTEDIMLHPAIVSNQFGLLYMNAQMAMAADVGVSGELIDLIELAVGSEVLRTASDLHGIILPAAVPGVETNPDTEETSDIESSASANPTKWTGNKGADTNVNERIEYTHLFDDLEKKSFFNVIENSGFAQPSEIFARPSVLMLIAGSTPGSYRLYYSQELSDAILGQVTITGRAEAPKVEYGETVKLLARGTDPDGWPQWSSNATRADLPSISEAVYDIIAGETLSIPDTLIMPGSAPRITDIRVYDHNTGETTQAEQSATLITARPPLATAGEIANYQSGVLTPFSVAYLLPAGIEASSDAETATCKLCGGSHKVGFEKCPNCIDKSGWVVCPQCHGSTGTSIYAEPDPPGSEIVGVPIDHLFCGTCNPEGKGEMPGWIKCPECSGTGTGTQEACPACGESGLTFESPCADCTSKLKELNVSRPTVHFKISKPAQPLTTTRRNIIPPYETFRTTVSMTLTPAPTGPYVMIYLDGKLLPPTVGTSAGNILHIWTVENYNQLTLNYMVAGADFNLLPSRLKVYDTPGVNVHTDCQHSAYGGEAVWPVGWVLRATAESVPIQVAEGIMSDKDIIYRYMFKNPNTMPDNEKSITPTIPYREGFTALARAISGFDKLLKAVSSLSAAVEVEVRSDEGLWSAITTKHTSTMKHTRMMFPPDSGSYTGKWVPWLIAQSWDTWCTDESRLDNSFLMAAISDIGQLRPKNLSEIPNPNDVTPEGSKDHFEKAVTAITATAGNTLPIDMDMSTARRAMTVQNVVAIRKNDDSSPVKAGTGACLVKGDGSAATDKVSPMHVPSVVNLANDGTFSFLNLSENFVQYDPKTGITITRKILDSLPNLMDIVCEMAKGTIIWVEDDGSVIEPEPLWNCLTTKPTFTVDDAPDEANIILMLKMLNLAFKQGEPTESELAEIDEAYRDTAISMNTAFNEGMKRFTSFLDGNTPAALYGLNSDSFVGVMADAHDLLTQCAQNVYQYDGSGGRMVCLQAQNVVEFNGSETVVSVRKVTITGDPMAYGLWFYNMRKTYLLWISSISVILSVLAEAIYVISSLKARFYPGALIQGSDGAPLQKGLDIFAFSSAAGAESPCYPIVSSDITIGQVGSSSLAPNEIQELFPEESLIYDFECEIPQMASMDLLPVPLVGFGAPSGSDFAESQAHYWADHEYYTQGEVAVALESFGFDGLFDSLRETFSKYDFMALEAGTLRYLNATGDGSVTVGASTYDAIRVAIEEGSRSSFPAVMQRKVAGVIDFSQVFPYVDTITTDISSATPIPVNFNSGMPWKIPDAVIPASSVETLPEGLASGLITYLLETEVPNRGTQLPSGMDTVLETAVRRLSDFLTDPSSNRMGAIISSDSVGDLRFIIPFAGFADSCDDGGALLAYTFNRLAYQLNGSFVDGTTGKVSGSAIAATLKSSVWNQGTEAAGYPSNATWAMNYNVFLSKRRVYLIAAQTIARFMDEQGENGKRITGTNWYIKLHYGDTGLPEEGDTCKIIRNVVRCYGFGSHFANAAMCGLDRDDDGIKKQRAVYLGACKPSYANPGKVGAAEQSIAFDLPLGWEDYEDLTPPIIRVSSNTVLTPMRRDDGSWATFVRYGDQTEDKNKPLVFNTYDTQSSWRKAAAVLLTGSHPAYTPKSGMSLVGFREAKSTDPTYSGIAAAILADAGAFIRKSFQYGSDESGAFQVAGTWLDKVHLIVQQI